MILYIFVNILKNVLNWSKRCKRFESAYTDVAEMIRRLCAAIDPRWARIGSMNAWLMRYHPLFCHFLYLINSLCVILTFLFILIRRKQVQATRADATRDNITVPTTLADYCIKTKVQTPSHSSLDMADFYDDDDYADDVPDDDDEDDDDCYYDDEDDSGNGESWWRRHTCAADEPWLLIW